MRDTTQRATAGGYVCIWTLREKKWPTLTVYFCFMSTDHTTVRFAPLLLIILLLLLPTRRPTPGPRRAATEGGRLQEPRSGDAGGAVSHPRVKYQLSCYDHTHCAFKIVFLLFFCCCCLRTYTHTHRGFDKDNDIVRIHTGVLQSELKTVHARRNVVHCWRENEWKGGCSRCRLIGGVSGFLAERTRWWSVRLGWVCLLTSPAVVNCIKAVSGSMASFYNSYCYGERRSKAHRTEAGEDRWDTTHSKQNQKKGRVSFFSEMFQYNM